MVYCNHSMQYTLQWVIALLGFVLRSAESRSETTVTDRPQGVIIVGTQIFIIIIITINNRILNFLECISIGIFHWENVLNFHGRINGGRFERLDAYVY